MRVSPREGSKLQLFTDQLCKECASESQFYDFSMIRARQVARDSKSEILERAMAVNPLLAQAAGWPFETIYQKRGTLQKDTPSHFHAVFILSMHDRMVPPSRCFPCQRVGRPASTRFMGDRGN